jgi:hypothetical protein
MARVHPIEEINANNTRNPFRDSVLGCLDGWNSEDENGEDGVDGAVVESHRAV